MSQNRDHMASIGRRGGEAVSRDREHMARIGRKGGEAVSRDRQHMATIGREGGESRANKGDMESGNNGGNHGGGSASHDKSEQAPPMSHAQSMEPTQKDGPSAH